MVPPEKFRAIRQLKSRGRNSQSGTNGTKGLHMALCQTNNPNERVPSITRGS